MYSSEAERRHELKLPITFAKGGLGGHNPTEAQFNELLYGLLRSEGQLFRSIESKKIIGPGELPVTCSVLDVFDRPLYLQVNDAYALVVMRAPVLTGVKGGEYEAVRAYLETYVTDLTFEMEPQGTLAGSMVVTLGELTAQVTPLLMNFCNRVRDAALAVKKHRAGRLNDLMAHDAIPDEVLSFFGLK